MMATNVKPAGADTSYWIKFFTDCGIPPSESTNYAITFTDNRIQKDMLMDLTKEYLSEMGIQILGDVIAILKHAKTVHSQLAREKALQGTQNISSTPRRQTPASRTVNHYLAKDPDSAPMNLPVVPKISKELSARLGGTPPVEEAGLRCNTIKLSQKLDEVVPVPRKRRVFPEHEGKYKITMPSGKTQKTKKILAKAKKKTVTVFDRLGQETRQTTVTDSGLIISSSSEASVFSRLGGKKAVKREATSTSIDLDSDVDESEPQLEYAGVLKSLSSSPPKKPKISVQKKPLTIQKQVKQVKVPAKPVVQTAGSLVSDMQISKKIKERLGKKTSVSEVSSTTDEPVSTKSGTFSRLGPKKTESQKKLQVSPGVFGRLGKQVSSSS